MDAVTTSPWRRRLRNAVIAVAVLVVALVAFGYFAVPAIMKSQLISTLQEELGRPPTQEEVGRSLDLPKKKLNIIKKAIRVCNSAPQTDPGESGWSIDEMLMDGRSKTPDTEMVETDDLKQVMQLLDKMDPREATVLRMRFGLDDEEPKTLKEIGERLGLTRERVRQIESEALAKLSESMNAD